MSWKKKGAMGYENLYGFALALVLVGMNDYTIAGYI